MYFLLIIIFLIFILYLYINHNYKETFKDGDTKKLNVNKNLYINNEQEYTYNNINANKLCIQDEDGTECISKEQLFNSLELPIFRRHAMCIDGACLTVNNLNKIKGVNNIKLETSGKPNSTTENTCINYNHIDASLSVRKQKNWETDNNGLKLGDDLEKIPEEKKTVSSKIGSFVSGSTVGKIGSVLADTMFPGSGRLISFFARKIAERNKVQYHSLYEPKGGWKTVVKDWCRGNPGGTKYGRKSKNNWRCQNPRTSSTRPGVSR